jgi:hypothetical protein
MDGCGLHHPLRHMTRLIFLLWVALAAAGAQAQSSVVPASHGVYEWLHTQRVNGSIAGYQHEQRPMSRGDVLGFLRQAELKNHALSRTDRSLLQDYLNEFDFGRFRHNRTFIQDAIGWFSHSVPDGMSARRDPHLFAGITRDSLLTGAYYVQYTFGNFSLNDASGRKNGPISAVAMKGFMNLGGFGLHIEAENASIHRHIDLLAYDPQWGATYEQDFTASQGARTSTTYRYEGFVSYQRPYLSLHLGTGALSLGPYVTDALLVREDAPYFTSFRYQIGTPKLNFSYMHGHLFSEAAYERTIYRGDTIVTKRSPQRWISSHRLTIEPIPQLTFMLHETIVYAARGLDANYLNPMFPYLFGEYNTGDRDNNMIGADVIARPISGTELFASLLIDDLPDISKIVKLDSTKMIFTLGLHQTLPFDTQLGASYTRSDANMYTHFMRLNTYENLNRPLGHSIGPNAEEWALRLTTRLPYRSKAMLGGRFIRKGLNPLGQNVGGDLLAGRETLAVPLYDGADVHDRRVLEAVLETEPFRGVRFSLSVSDTEVLKGTRIPSETFVDLRFSYGF